MIHTKEPWQWCVIQPGYVVTLDMNVICALVEFNGDGTAMHAFDNAYSNARRIVACVNACAGIPTEELELVENIKFPNPIYSELKKQRDELIEAGKALVERWDTPNWKDVKHTGEFIAKLRDVIDKCEDTK